MAATEPTQTATIPTTEPTQTATIPTTEPSQAEKPPRVKRAREVYMLHDPVDFSCKGRFTSTGPRFAAQKAATRGFKKIYLRKTNTKKVFCYDGSIVKLETPQVIQRGDQTITYTKKSMVKTARKPFLYEGTLPADDDLSSVPENPKAMPAEA
jgi:hypothetical protein